MGIQMEFEDNMKKESRFFLIWMVVCAIFMIVFPVLYYYFVTPETPLWQIIIAAVWFFVLFLLCLYAFLYSIIYKVKVTSDIIYYKSLFGKKIVSVKNIISYRFLRCYKAGFYQYDIKYKTDEGIKSFKLSTKHQQDLIALLETFQIKASMGQP